MTWKDLLVAIWTPTTDGKGETGTGFPIAPDLVMTARHVVCPKNRDLARSIEINWWHSKEDWKKVESDDTAVVWQCEKYDVAVLKVQRPRDREGVVSLAPKKPVDHASWASAGFSRADVRDGIQYAGSFCGKVMSMAEGDRFFEITAEAPPAVEGGWKGASGMPIVVDGRLLGVCSELPPGYEGRKILVSPIWKLWQKDECHPSLQDILPFSHFVTQFKGKLVDEIRRMQIRDEDLNYIFHEIMDGRIDYVLPCGEEKFDTLVGGLLNLSPDQVFRKFGAYTHEVNNDRCTAISRFVQAVSPFLFAVNGTDVINLVMQARSGGVLVTDVPIGTHTMAEILVAASQKRPGQFLPRRQEHDLPMGAKLIPIRPIFGNQPSKDLVKSAIISELKEHYPEKELLLVGDFKGDSIKELCDVYKVSGMANALSALRIRMRIDRERGGSLPYMAFILPENEDERNSILDSVRGICKELPDLTIVVLDSEFCVSDLEALSLFPYFVPMQQTDT